MKRLLFIIAALFATAQAQTIQTIGAPTTTVVSRGNFRTDSIFYLPKRTKLPTDSGAVRYQISDSSVYYWTGAQWRRLGVHIDTAAMLLPYLRKSDTTAMLSPYLKESDTAFLSNRINLKVNISDTATMLSPYVLGSGTANYLPKFNASRSVINSKVYESGTNLMFNTTTPSFTTSGISTIENNATSSAVYTFKTSDSLRAYLGFGGANTLDINNLRTGDIRFYTSATLRGRFQTDGTFRLNSLTGTGSRAVVADANGVLSASSSPTDLIDTTYMSTRAWRQKGIDSVSANVALKVNISDTSTMLSPYLRKVDTTAMLSPYARTSNVNASLALKLNISDTSSMLSPYARTATVNAQLAAKVNVSDTSSMLTPYLRKADTLTLSNRINTKLNISDTSTMLSPYARTATVNASLATKVNISDTSLMLTPYLRKTDTISLSNRINLKVNISDTLSMLSPYLRKVDTTAMLSPYYRSATATAALALKLNISDTTTMLSPYYRSATASSALATKLNISDTSTMLSPYLRKVDTTAMLSPYARTSNVNASLALKVNTSDTATMLTPYVRAAGIGLSKSGQTLNADTSVLSTRAWRQKGIDSVSTLITARPTGTGTTNYVTKWTGTNTQGISQIFDNGTFVGINTTTLGGVLTINGTDPLIGFQNGGTTKWKVGLENTLSDRFVWYNNAGTSYRMILTASGNLGLGVTPSAWGSNWAAFELPYAGWMGSKLDGGFYLLDNAFFNGTNFIYKFATSRGASSYNAYNGTHQWQTASLGTAGNTISFTQAMILTNGGNLGVGIENPSTRIHAFGTSGATTIIAEGATTNAAYGRLEMRGRPSAAGQSSGFIVAASTEGGQSPVNVGAIDFAMSGATGNAHYMSFATHSGSSLSERMRIFANGRIGVNTTSDAGDYKLQVSGNVYSTGTYTSAAPTDGTAAPWRLGSYVTTAPTATGYVQVEINGVKYKLLAATY